MFRSYCITFRPRNGLSNTTSAELISWCKKQPYAFYAEEKSDEARHAHIQVWYDEPRERGTICKAMQRIGSRTVTDWDDAQLKVLRSGVKIAYSDWYLDYLAENMEKTDTEKSVIKYEHPPEDTIPYYATQEDQEALQAKANAVDKRMYSLEQKFNEWNENQYEELTIRLVAKFLADQMFNSRTIEVKIHQRDRVALCTSLYSYITRSADPSLFLVKDKKMEKIENMLIDLN